MSKSHSVGDSVNGRPSVVHRPVTRPGQIYQSRTDNSAALQAQRWVVTPDKSFRYMIRIYLLPWPSRYQPNRRRGSSASSGGSQSLSFGTQRPRASLWLWSTPSLRCFGPSW
uniref:Uncharacterized protein n=1 Tax=Moschus moschiferus TaxID=68415 RepID=A0A8C6FKF3_MOSMO